MNNMT